MNQEESKLRKRIQAGVIEFLHTPAGKQAVRETVKGILSERKPETATNKKAAMREKAVKKG